MKKLLSFLLCLLLLAGCAETYNGPTVAKTVCTSQERTHYATTGEAYQHVRIEYTYDIYGNLVRQVAYSNDEPTLKTIRRYDENGNVIRQIQYSLSGLLPEKIVDARYSYDSQGRMTATRHHSGGLSWDDCTIVYDDEAGTRTTTGDGSVTVEYLNGQSWVVYDEQTFSDGRVCRSEYDRRPDGQIEAMRSYEDGVLILETVMTYDDQGRILTQTDHDGRVHRWEYGEDYEKHFDPSGAVTVTVYNADGSTDHIQSIGEDGLVTSLTIFRYTEIQVPAP